jgi:hypothetical protein
MVNNPAGEPPSVEQTRSGPNAQGAGRPRRFDLDRTARAITLR